jgi:hypothetical protein
MIFRLTMTSDARTVVVTAPTTDRGQCAAQSCSSSADNLIEVNGATDGWYCEAHVGDYMVALLLPESGCC